ncbi:MAG: hypothetical protein GXX91_00275 [Verrucomicrobiaceae bacterium]|nr:hypothetical protein [Verrucomicrobiaceae bacterium]
MEKRNRYNNRVGWMMMLRLALSGGLLFATGAGFVLVRNQHVIIGNEIGAFEQEIVAFEQEIELWELRIAGVRDRNELSRRLRWAQSDLEGIDHTKVIEIKPRPRLNGPVASAY